MKLKYPHDLFFKGTFGNVAVAGDFFTHFSPESVVKHIDIDTLESQKELDDRQTSMEYFETMIRYLLGARTRLKKKRYGRNSRTN